MSNELLKHLWDGFFHWLKPFITYMLTGIEQHPHTSIGISFLIVGLIIVVLFGRRISGLVCGCIVMVVGISIFFRQEEFVFRVLWTNPIVHILMGLILGAFGMWKLIRWRTPRQVPPASTVLTGTTTTTTPTPPPA